MSRYTSSLRLDYIREAEADALWENTDTDMVIPAAVPGAGAHSFAHVQASSTPKFVP